jgi:hypothetical protein
MAPIPATSHQRPQRSTEHGASSRFAGRRLIVAAALLLGTLGAGCAASGAHWADPGVHQVDGYWVTQESSCGSESPADYCDRLVATGTTQLPPGSPAITRIATAGVPMTWVRSDGTEIPTAWGGFGVPVFVIFDLAGGQRRAFEIYCEPAGAPGGASCVPLPGDAYRVGGPGLEP